MKRGTRYARVLWVIGFTAVASVELLGVSHAQITNFADFNVDVEMGTNTVQTSGGTVLFSASDLGTSRPGLLPLDLAQQIAADPLVPTYIQDHIGSLVGGDDYDYLVTGDSLSTTGALLNVSGNVVTTLGEPFTNVVNDLLSGAPAAASTNETFTMEANDQYVVIASNSTTVIVAILNFNFDSETIVETVPEPSSLLLVTCGLSLLGCTQRRRIRASKPRKEIV